MDDDVVGHQRVVLGHLDVVDRAPLGRLDLDDAVVPDVLVEDLVQEVAVEGVGQPLQAIAAKAAVAEHHTFVVNDVVVSNCAPPFRQAEVDIMYGTGISREGSLLDIGVDLGIVKKSGAWYTYEGEQLGQGRENAKAFLVENPEIMVEVSERIRQQVAPAVVPAPAAGADDDAPITLE